MMIPVYYVTAERKAEGNVPEDRQELGKFFARSAAEDHAKKIGKDWKHVRVESREEDATLQHPAHSAQGGRKAAWEE